MSRRRNRAARITDESPAQPPVQAVRVAWPDGDTWRAMPSRGGDLAVLYAALSAAQAAASAAEKAHANPHYGSQYADEEDVAAVFRAHFAPLGLAFIAAPEDDQDGRTWLTGMITHACGAWIKTTVRVRVAAVAPKRTEKGADDPLPLEWLVQHGDAEERIAMRNPQRVTGSVTYLRRMLLKALAGITAKGEDDDGNRAARKSGRAEVPLWKLAKALACPECGVVGAVGESKDAPGEFYCWRKAKPPGCGAQPLYLTPDHTALTRRPAGCPTCGSMGHAACAPEQDAAPVAAAPAQAGGKCPHCGKTGTAKHFEKTGETVCLMPSGGCGKVIARAKK